MIPENEYRNVKSGFCEPEMCLKIELSVPENPKKDTKPSATRRAGIQSGTEESESRNFFPKKFLFAVKKALEIPIKSAITVEQIA